MKNLLANLANLLKVKTIVTVSVIAVFIVLSLRGFIEPGNVMMIVTAVISFYFGTVTERNGGGGA